MTYKLSTACMDIYNAGTLKVSKNISAAFSRFLLGLSGASVSNTGCCKTKKKQESTKVTEERQNTSLVSKLYGFGTEKNETCDII